MSETISPQFSVDRAAWSVALPPTILMLVGSPLLTGTFLKTLTFFFLTFFLVRSLWSIESQTCSEVCNPSRQARRAECIEDLQNNLEFYFPMLFVISVA